jgi:tripartite-type tricarboxylate transporter receptor subunit TctC
MRPVDVVHVPYRGDAPILTALIAGDVQLAFVPQPTGLAHIQGNLVRAYAVTGSKRSIALPDVPTIAEAGIAGLEGGSWIGMFVPAGTPPDIVLAIQKDVARTLRVPEVRDRILAVGQEPVGNAPADFDAMFKADIAKFSKIVEQARIPKLD